MSRPIVASRQKVAERLCILNDRSIGMISRLYNIKKVCQDVKLKPSFFTDKSLESTIKNVYKRFPHIDSKNMHAISGIRMDIIKSLSLYYYTFVDFLDLKDQICDLLTTIDALKLHLDVTVNFDLTRAYLDIVTSYVSLMIILSRIDDRKVVLGLFNASHEQVHGKCDPSFPRLGQMIVDYDVPLRRLYDEFIPHSTVLFTALISLRDVFPRRNLSADQWMQGRMLSLTSNPVQMLNPAQTDTMPCEYLSLDTMERWLFMCSLLCHQHLAQAALNDLWTNVLQSGWAVTLFRDETLHMHQLAQRLFEQVKGYSRRISEIKDCATLALTTAAHMHRERRKFLRVTLHELNLVLQDQPGLLGPKALFVFMALSFARDEVLWLLRHVECGVPSAGSKRGGGNKAAQELGDRLLPELLFEMECLRSLVRKYSQVIQRYHVQYLSGYDTTALSLTIQQLQVCPEEENTILSAICANISDVSVRQVEQAEVIDFRGLRMDWMRLQVFTSCGKAALHLEDNTELSSLLNTIVFHTKMVDYLDEMLVETSDLSAFCFFNSQFEDHFRMCLEFPAQNRYIVCFAQICSHFSSCIHELCPEEHHHIRERSLSMVNMCLDEMAKEAKNIITTICDEQCSLSDKLLPKHCAHLIVAAVNKRKWRKKRDRGVKKTDSLCGPQDEERPGQESVRRLREDLTIMDKLHMALTELCYAINYCPTIRVWEYTFAPREYLYQHLETRFSRALVGMAMYNAERHEIAKPSELLASVRAYMTIMQSVENLVHIDVSSLFGNILLQQTQPVDAHGEKTLASLYVGWYTNTLLRRVTMQGGAACYSPVRRAFVSTEGHPVSASVAVTANAMVSGGSSSAANDLAAGVGSVDLNGYSATPGTNSSSAGNSTSGAVSAELTAFSTEEYTDINELQALAELIGCYGMRSLNETLVSLIVAQLQEIRKLVAENRDILVVLRSNFDKSDTMHELCRKLVGADVLLHRMIVIGQIVSFRSLCFQALNSVLRERSQFLLSSIEDFWRNSADSSTVLESGRCRTITEVATAAGFDCSVDTLLSAHIRRLSHTVSSMSLQHAEHGATLSHGSADSAAGLAGSEEEYLSACLLVVFVACSLPRLARAETSVYLPQLQAHLNNAHCLAEAVRTVFYALFSVCNQGDMDERLKEFLAMASSILLRSDDKETMATGVGRLQRESVHLLIDIITRQLPCITLDLLDSCYSYSLLRTAYQDVYRQVSI